MMARFLLPVLFCLGLLGAATAGEHDDGLDAAQAFLENREQIEPPKLDLIEHLDDEGKAVLTAALTEYFRYFETGYIHRRDVFKWQLLSSKVIFYVVIALVLVGVYFSWLQFMLAYRSARDEPDAPEPDITAEPAAPAEDAGRFASLRTSLDVGQGGIKVSSSVLGVVILVISLAFFYLYLEHIYPIEEIF